MSVSVVVVGTDGSDNAQHALAWAGGLAAQTGARIVVVHVFQPLEHLGSVPPPVDFGALRDHAEELLDGEWTQPLSDRGVTYETELRQGNPVEVLVAVADAHDADLVVVGSRGLGTVKGLVLGSTSMKLPLVAGRAVAIIPPPPS